MKFKFLKKNDVLFFVILIIFSIFNYSNNKGIIFPFETEKMNKEISNYIDSFKQNKIYITIEIGSPSKIINIYLTMDTNYLIIANSSIDNSYYNNEKSITYKNISFLDNYFLEYFKKGYLAKETFLFKTSLNNNEKQKFNNIEFIHALEYKDNTIKNSGYFGLQIPKKYKPNIYKSLKKENVISEEYWNLKYTSDDKGYFILGEYPSEYNDEINVRKTNALPCTEENTNLCWHLKFNDIKFGEINVNRDRLAEITPELGFIIGTGEYEQKISENFFNKFNNKCQKKSTEDYKYNYYECDKDFDTSNFKNLEFIHTDLEFDFIMTKDDLFKIYNNKIYFLIIFSVYSEKSWKLGKPFIKKYNFGYNTDNNKIYFYHKEEKADESKNNSNTIYYIVIGVLGIGAIIMAIFVIINKYFKPKRKIANELKEEINISSNQDNALGI